VLPAPPKAIAGVRAWKALLLNDGEMVDIMKFFLLSAFALGVYFNVLIKA
jgi:hypothetical protein